MKKQQNQAYGTQKGDRSVYTDTGGAATRTLAPWRDSEQNVGLVLVRKFAAMTLSREILVIGAATLAMAAVVAFTPLAIGWAAAVIAVIVAAELIGSRLGIADQGAEPDEQSVSEPAESPLEQDPDSRLDMLAAVAEAMPEPFLLLDSAGDIVHSNAPARAVFETVEPGRHVSAVIRAPMVLDAITHASDSGGSVQVDYEQRVPIERRFEVHIASLVPKGGEKQPAGRASLALLLRDLTRQERVERMRADFVANASHELRTPLASVLGFVETLKGAAKNDPKAHEEFLDLMHVQASRMARLIDDLLSLNRIELNAHLRPNDEVDVVQVVGHVIDMLGPLADEADLELNFSKANGPVFVRGDRDELVQVFQNLIENAIKYGQSGEHVEISCVRGEEGGAQITVRDFGPGISAEHIPRLTERFYRIDVVDSRQKGGTGLGLAIVKHILNRHRARLSIRSRVGEGASFIVDLPSSDNIAA